MSFTWDQRGQARAPALFFDVTQYGADPTGSTDSSTAIQACLDAAQAAALTPVQNINLHPVVYFPAGVYNTFKPIFMGGAGVRLVGASKDSVFIGAANNANFYFGPGILASQAPSPAPSYTTSLLTGPGNAYDLSNNAFFFPLDWIRTPRTFNGLSAFTAECTVKLTGNQVGNRGNILSSESSISIGTNPGVNDVVNSAYQMWIGGSAILLQNKPIVGMTINGVFYTLISSVALTLGVTSHIAVTYDGTNIKLWINGVLNQTQNAPGTITQSPFESVTLGANYLTFPAGIAGTKWPAALATVDSVRLSTATNYTSNFTPPVAKFTGTNNDALVLNFETVNLGNYQPNVWCRATSASNVLGIAATNAYLYPLQTGGTNNFSFCGFYDLSTPGLYLQGAVGVQGANLNLSGGAWGLWNTNNGFQSNFDNIYTTTSTSQGQCGGIVSTFGPNEIRRHYHTGNGTAFAGWGAILDNAYYNSGATILACGSGGPNGNSASGLIARRVLITDEGSTNNSVPVRVLYGRARFTDCVFEHNSTTGQLVELSGPTNEVQFHNCEFNARTGTAACIIQSGATAPYNVVVANPIRWPSGGDPSVPLAIDANLNIIDNINMTGLPGVSSTQLVAAQNLDGQVTVSGASTTGTVSFPRNEPNTSYRIVFTPVASTGTPAAGSNRPLSVAKNVGSAVLTVETAPGVGNSVTFDWHLLR